MTIEDGTTPDEPLGMPRGSVRSLLSLGVVAGAFAIAAYFTTLAAPHPEVEPAGVRG